MPNTIFFISADYLSFKDWPAEAKNIYPSVLIEQSQPQQTLELYKYCNNKPLHNFSISILITDPLSGEFINTAVSFLFIPYYYAVNNKRIITLTGKVEKLLHDAKSSLLAFSAEQGINNLVINCLLKKDISTAFRDGKQYKLPVYRHRNIYKPLSYSNKFSACAQWLFLFVRCKGNPRKN